MSVERFFADRDEEYDAAAWLSTLHLMQRLAGRIEGQQCTATRLSALVLHKPDEFLGEFQRFASYTGEVKTAEKDFLVEMGAADRGGRIARGLSDAALLLCDDPVSQEIKESSSFTRLVPLVDEMAEYCDEKFLRDVSHEDLKATSYPARLHYARTESDFYIRHYDGEPQIAAISPLYL